MIDQSMLRIAGMAFSLVFATLSILAVVLFALRALARRNPGEKPLVRADISNSMTKVRPEILVVLAAAAHEALGVPIRIHHVHVHRDSQAASNWSRSGRMDIMLSHRVGKKP